MPSWKKVILSGSDASLNSLDVATSLTASGLIYPTTDGTFADQVLQTNAAGDLSFGDVSTIYENVYNGEATTLLKGTPVYVSGSNGANPKVYRADASNAAKMPVVYIVAENINTASTGRGIVLGLITGIDLTGYTAGQEVYVAVGGGWTTTRPTGNSIVQVLGIISKPGSGGQGLVLNPGPANLPNLATNNVWMGDSNGYPQAVSTASLFVTSASYALTSTSASHALNANNAISSSYALSGSYSLTATSASHALASNTSISASHAVSADTASFLPTTTNLNIASISASNAVFTSASIGFLQTVSGSATIIGDAYVVVNSSQTTRYAGLAVYESGSNPPVTASWNFDSQTNDWFYSYSSSNGTDYGVALFGPEYATEGSPTYLTSNRIPKASGSHHLNDSNLSDDGTRVSSAVSLTVTGSITASAGLLGTASYATQALTASYALQALSASYSPGTNQTLQQVTDNGNTTTNSISVTGFTSSIVGGNGVTGTFRSTNGYNNLLLISTGSTGINYGEVNIILRDSSDPGGVNNDGIISYGGANTATLSIKTATNNEFKLQGTTTDHVHSFSNGGTGSLVWNSVDPFIQRTGSGQTQFLGLATSASYSTRALSSSFAATASYVATSSYIPTLDQVTTQGSTTTNNIAVGSLTSTVTGNGITGAFKTTNGFNSFIIESSGSGGVLPGLVQVELRDYSTSLNGAIITYGGTDGDILSFLNEGGTRLRLSGSTLDQTYIFENGSNAGTGSFSWNNSTPFIQKIGTGQTQFLGLATSASYAPGTNQTLQQVTTNGNTTTNNMIITGSLNLRSNGSNINAYLRTPSSFGSGISFQDANTSAAEFVHCGALGDSFYIASGFTLNVLVDPNGNTGFKTTSPASTVDVNGDLTVRANATVTGSITNTNSGFKSMVFTSGSSIANSTTNGTLFTISAGTYESVTMDYVVFDSTRTNKRAGTLRGTWDDNTTTIVFDETSTTDIGNTTAFTLDMVNNGSGTVTVRTTNNVGSAMTIIYDYKLLG